MGQIIDGNKIARKISKRTKDLMEELEGRKAGLAIILVGDREDSELYVKLKEKEAGELGIDTRLYRFGQESDPDQLLETIRRLNKDDGIDAILVQLPLPRNFDTGRVISEIEPLKDVDRFHPKNLEILLSTCVHGHVMPPVLGVVLEMLKEIDFDLEGKKACVIANSDVFGKGLAKVIECKGSQVEIAHPDDVDLFDKTTAADLLISAVGRPHFIKSDLVKKDAVVIDIGITKKGKKVFGDVDFENVKNKALFITPVPGGVGPATVSMLLLNTVMLAKQFKEKRKKSTSI